MTHFHVYDTATDRLLWVRDSDSDTSLMLPGLQPNVAYSLRIAAVNHFGKSCPHRSWFRRILNWLRG